MKKDTLKEIVEKMISEVEEEEVGVSLLTTFYQNETELSFFLPPERRKVIKILRTLASDSRRHKRVLTRMIGRLSGGIS